MREPTSGQKFWFIVAVFALIILLMVLNFIYDVGHRSGHG